MEFTLAFCKLSVLLLLLNHYFNHVVVVLLGINPMFLVIHMMGFHSSDSIPLSIDTSMLQKA